MVLPPVLYFAHIGMGMVGLLSGTAALTFRKGSRQHRTAGNVFFVSMLIMSAIGAYGSLYVPEMLSVMVGLLTFYLVATSWVTVMRKEGQAGLFENGAALAALAIAFGCFKFGLEAVNSETGLKDGFPPAPHFIFGTVALLAAAGDVRLIRRCGIFGAQRIARHLWRMCFALFIAAASLFLGQPQVFPEPVRGTLILAAPVILVIVLMIYWLIRVLFTHWLKGAQKASDRALLYAKKDD